MGRILGCRSGEITGLLSLPREHWEAIEADLLAKGFVLADIPSRVSWRAVLAYTTHADRQSALFRTTAGARGAWDTSEYLLALLVDIAQTELWAKTKDAKTGRNRPKPVRRPGDEPDADEIRYGTESMDLDDMKAWLDERRENPRPMAITEVVT